MTEAEWLACSDPRELLTNVPTLSARKSRLLSARVAELALRSHSPAERQLLSADPETRPQSDAMSVAEQAIEDLARFADGQIAAKRLRRSLHTLRQLYRHWTRGVH